MKIVTAGIEHLSLVLSLFEQYREFYKIPSESIGARAFIAERLKEGDSVIYLVLSESNEAMGFAQLYPSFSSLSLKRQWILNDLFVSPAHRRKNVARELVLKCEALARNTGAKGLTLMTGIENKEAQALYLSLGWVQVTQFLTFVKSC